MGFFKELFNILQENSKRVDTLGVPSENNQHSTRPVQHSNQNTYTNYSQPQQQNNYQQDQRQSNYQQDQQQNNSEWSLAIVDNNAVPSGTKITDYGYQLAHCDDARNGEVVYVNDAGKVLLVEQGEMSEDTEQQVIKFRQKYHNAKQLYENNLKANKLAAEGAERFVVDTKNPHQVNSVLDVLSAFGSDLVDNATNLFNLSAEDANLQDTAEQLFKWDDTVRAGKEFIQLQTLYKKSVNKKLEKKYGEDWRTNLATDPNKLNAVLMDNTIDDDVKRYMMYQVVTGDDAKHPVIETLANLGETMDWAGNGVKGALLWMFDNGKTVGPDGVSIVDFPDLSKDKDYKDLTLGEAITQGYASPFSESGRVSNDYDTGSGLVDLAFEMLSDPTTWISAGISSAIKKGAKEGADVALKTVGKNLDNIADPVERAAAKSALRNQVVDNLRGAINKGVREGMDDTALATQVAKAVGVQPEMYKTFIPEMAEAFEYSRNLRIIRSIEKAGSAVERTDKVMQQLVWYTSPLGPAALLNNFIKKNPGKARTLVDAITTVKGANGTAEEAAKHMISPVEVEEITSKFNSFQFVQWLKHGEDSLCMLDKATKQDMFVRAHDKICSDIEHILLSKDKRTNAEAIAEIEKYFKENVSLLTTNGELTIQGYLDTVIEAAKKSGIDENIVRMRSDALLNTYANAMRYASIFDRVNMEKALGSIEHVLDDTQGAFRSEILKNYTKSAEKQLYDEVKKTRASIGRSINELKKTDLDVSNRNPAAVKIRNSKNITLFKTIQSKKHYRKLLPEDTQFRLSSLLTDYEGATDTVKNGTDMTSRIIKLNKELDPILEQVDRTLQMPHLAQDTEAALLDRTIESLDFDVLSRYVSEETMQALRQFDTTTHDAWYNTERRELLESIRKDLNTTTERVRDAVVLQPRTIKDLQRTAKRTAVLNQNSDKVLQEVCDAFGTSVKDVTSLENYADLGQRAYQVQLSQRAMLDLVVSDPNIVRYTDTLTDPSTPAGMLCINRALSRKSLASKIYYNTLDYSYTVKRYTDLTNRIEQSPLLPQQLKEGLLDSVISKEAQYRAKFDVDDLDARAVKARTLSKSMMDHALKYTAQTDELLSNMYPELQCCTKDTAANVVNIEKVLMEQFGDTIQKSEFPIIYSVDTFGNNLREISFKVPGEDRVHTITPPNQQLSIHQHAKIVSDIKEIVDLYKPIAQEKHKNLTFYGFNTSAAGMDTAYKLNRYIKNYSTVSPFHQTAMRDVADLLRAKDGLPVIPNEAYEELTRINRGIIDDWCSLNNTTGLGMRLNVVPDSKKDTLDAVDLLKDTSADLEELNTVIEQLAFSLKSNYKKIGNINSTLIDTVRVVDDAHENLMPRLRVMESNSEYLQYTLKQVYDSRIANKLFDTSKSAYKLNENLAEVCTGVQSILNELEDYNAIYSLSITPDDVKELAMHSSFKKVLGYDSDAVEPIEGVSDKVLQLSDNMSKSECFAFMRYIYKNYGTNETKRFLQDMSVQRSALGYSLYDMVTNTNDAYKAITTSMSNFANTSDNIVGAATDATSRINRAAHTLAQLNRTMDDVDAYLSYFESIDVASSHLEKSGAIELGHVYYQKNIAESFRESVRTLVDKVNKYNAVAEHDINFRWDDEQQRFVTRDVLESRLVSRSRAGGLQQLDKSVTDYSRIRELARLKHISSLSDEALLKHFVKDCNGRMVLDVNHTYVDTKRATDLAKRLTELDVLGDGTRRVKCVSEDGILRVYLDVSGMSDEQITEMYNAIGDVDIPKLRINNSSTVIKDAETMSVDEDINALADKLYDIAPASYSYGIPQATSPAVVQGIDEKYFNGIEGLLDVKYLNLLGAYTGKANCMYYGDIAALTRDGQNFLSNNYLTNICSSFSAVLSQTDTDANVMNFIFSGAYDLGNFQHLVRSELGDLTPKQIQQVIKEHGRTVAHLGWDKDHYVITELDVSTKRGWTQAMSSKQVAVVTLDDLAKLRKIAAHEAQTTMTPKKMNKAIELWNDQIRPMYITSYLFQKYGTWVHNAVDSFTKGLMQEGLTHGMYVVRAKRLLPMYKETERQIVSAYGRVNDSTIDKFFMENTGALTKKEYKRLREYFSNSISGTQAEDALRLFADDPVRALKEKIDLGLSDTEYENIIKQYKVLSEDSEHTVKEKMIKLHEQLSQTYDAQTTSKLVNMYSNYDEMAERLRRQFNPSKIPIVGGALGKWYNFNADRFSNIETYNRLAIYLNEIDKGNNPSQALAMISASQFDYSKSAFMKGLEQVAPFSTFRLYNIDFWLSTAPNYRGFSTVVGDTAKVLAEQAGENYSDYEFTEDDIADRIQSMMYLQTVKESDIESSIRKFGSWEEYIDAMSRYRGTSGADATSFGWIQINDKVYFKAGMSLIDAFGTMEVLTDPAATVKDYLFAPLSSLIDLCKYAAENDLSEDKAMEKFVVNNMYELSSLLPVIGSLYYSAYSSTRAAMSNSDLLHIVAPSLFGKVRTPGAEHDRYLDKPVGYDWYNQSEDYRKTHRYVVGVSYVPTWVSKNPASYINTYGRLQQLGFSREQIQTLFDIGGVWWFSKTGNGYKLNNHQLQIQDQNTWNNVKETLRSFGWSDSAIESLMLEAATPSWTANKVHPNKAYRGYGSLAGKRSQASVRYAFNKARYATNAAARTKNPYMTSKGKPIKRSPSGYMTYTGDGRKVRMGRGGRTSYASSGTRGTHNEGYRWRQRQRNIYKDNYAKYGASRMAMRQNLKNYSNRSVTELHRSDQKIAYARINNRWWR